MSVDLNPIDVPCGRCGDPAKGWAFINGVRFCHDGPSPTCYEEASWEWASASWSDVDGFEAMDPRSAR